MPLDPNVYYRPDEADPDRPFTHLNHDTRDLDGGEALRAELLKAMAASGGAGIPKMTIAYPDEDGSRTHRHIFLDSARALIEADPYLILFCGFHRPEVDPASAAELDEKMVALFPRQQQLLTYSTWGMGNCGHINLVVFEDERGVDHWTDEADHLYAAGEFSWSYYSRIRIHHARLAGGVSGEGRIQLRKTKYFDFLGPEPWCALRERE